MFWKGAPWASHHKEQKTPITIFASFEPGFEPNPCFFRHSWPKNSVFLQFCDQRSATTRSERYKNNNNISNNFKSSSIVCRKCRWVFSFDGVTSLKHQKKFFLQRKKNFLCFFLDIKFHFDSNQSFFNFFLSLWRKKTILGDFAADAFFSPRPIANAKIETKGLSSTWDRHVIKKKLAGRHGLVDRALCSGDRVCRFKSHPWQNGFSVGFFLLLHFLRHGSIQ